MAALFADENFSLAVVQQLRLVGHDVTTVPEVGIRGAKDEAVLAFAVSQGRAVLTFNRRHFIRLHQQTASHAGIFVCTMDAPDALAKRIDEAIAASSDLANQVDPHSARSMIGACATINSLPRPPGV